MGLLVGLFVLIGVIAFVVVLGAMASGVGIIAGVISLFVAPPWRNAEGGTAGGVRTSATRAEILKSGPTPGTYGWDEYVAADNARYAKKIARADRRALKRSRSSDY